MKPHRLHEHLSVSCDVSEKVRGQG